MAIPWLAVLKSVPWTDVIKNAPAVADGAKKLLGTLGKQAPAPQTHPDTASPAGNASAAEALQARCAALEEAVSGLHEQLRASSALLTSLAEQNAELIKHVELNRRRQRWLAGLLMLCASLALTGLLVTLSR